MLIETSTAETVSITDTHRYPILNEMYVPVNQEQTIPILKEIVVTEEQAIQGMQRIADILISDCIEQKFSEGDRAELLLTTVKFGANYPNDILEGMLKKDRRLQITRAYLRIKSKQGTAAQEPVIWEELYIQDGEQRVNLSSISKYHLVLVGDEVRFTGSTCKAIDAYLHGQPVEMHGRGYAQLDGGAREVIYNFYGAKTPSANKGLEGLNVIPAAFELSDKEWYGGMGMDLGVSNGEMRLHLFRELPFIAAVNQQAAGALIKDFQENPNYVFDQFQTMQDRYQDLTILTED